MEMYNNTNNSNNNDTNNNNIFISLSRINKQGLGSRPIITASNLCDVKFRECLEQAMKYTPL